MRESPNEISRLLTPAEAARLLGYRPRSLEALRQRGGGPPFVHLTFSYLL